MYRKENIYNMSNYAKAKLANESIYEIVPGGLRETSDKSKLTIIALMGERTLSEVDSETDVAENVTAITILDSSGDEMEIKKGYKYQTGCKKQKGYVVGRETVDTGTVDADGNIVTEYRDVTATVVIIELVTGDVRAELDETKKEVSELNATVDALVVASLEG